jgi:hypothetical protein
MFLVVFPTLIVMVCDALEISIFPLNSSSLQYFEISKFELGLDHQHKSFVAQIRLDSSQIDSLTWIDSFRWAWDTPIIDADLQHVFRVCLVSTCEPEALTALPAPCSRLQNCSSIISDGSCSLEIPLEAVIEIIQPSDGGVLSSGRRDFVLSAPCRDNPANLPLPAPASPLSSRSTEVATNIPERTAATGDAGWEPGLGGCLWESAPRDQLPDDELCPPPCRCAESRRHRRERGSGLQGVK